MDGWMLLCCVMVMRCLWGREVKVVKEKPQADDDGKGSTTFKMEIRQLSKMENKLIDLSNLSRHRRRCRRSR